jgi:hypothetical protein
MATKKKTSAAARKAAPQPKTVKASASVTIQTKALPDAFDKRLPGTGALVKSGGADSLVINVAKLNKSLMRDQRARLVSSMGCVSNPGGPSC